MSTEFSMDRSSRFLLQHGHTDHGHTQTRKVIQSQMPLNIQPTHRLWVACVMITRCPYSVNLSFAASSRPWYLSRTLRLDNRKCSRSKLHTLACSITANQLRYTIHTQSCFFSLQLTLPLWILSSWTNLIFHTPHAYTVHKRSRRLQRHMIWSRQEIWDIPEHWVDHDCGRNGQPSWPFP